MIPYDMINERDVRSAVQTVIMETFKQTQNTMLNSSVPTMQFHQLSMCGKLLVYFLPLFFLQSLLPSFIKSLDTKALLPLKNFNIV